MEYRIFDVIRQRWLAGIFGYDSDGNYIYDWADDERCARVYLLKGQAKRIAMSIGPHCIVCGGDS